MVLIIIILSTSWPLVCLLLRNAISSPLPDCYWVIWFYAIEYEFYKYFHPTFLYESVLNILCLFVLFFIIRNIKGRFDGLIFASYLIFYSIIRFFIEALRLDCIVNVGSFHLPQIASIVTIVIALIIMLIGKFQQNKEKSI